MGFKQCNECQGFSRSFQDSLIVTRSFNFRSFQELYRVFNSFIEVLLVMNSASKLGFYLNSIGWNKLIKTEVRGFIKGILKKRIHAEK